MKEVKKIIKITFWCHLPIAKEEPQTFIWWSITLVTTPTFTLVKNKNLEKILELWAWFGGAKLHNNWCHNFPFPTPGICAQNLHFEALWSLSECVWMESADTSWAITYPCQPCLCGDSHCIAPSPAGTWAWLQVRNEPGGRAKSSGTTILTTLLWVPEDSLVLLTLKYLLMSNHLFCSSQNVLTITSLHSSNQNVLFPQYPRRAQLPLPTSTS